MDAKTRSLLLQYGAAVVLALGATALRAMLNPVFEDRIPFSPFFAAILFAAWYGGLGPGLTALGVGLFLEIHFFVEPIHLLRMPRMEDRIAHGMFVVVGLLMIGVIEYLRRAQQEAMRRSEELAELSRQLRDEIEKRSAVAAENARLYAAVKDADRRKDDFLAMLAHELRNPLAPIRSGLDLLETEGVDAETAAWARNIMKQQVHHLVRLVDDLLDVSRIMRGKVQLRRQRMTVADAVQHGIETARPLIQSQGHELHVSLPGEPLWIDADPVRMTQVIANLLNNAAKYHDKPGHIWIDAECRGGMVALRIRDDGLGMEKELLDQVFDLFTQADRSIARSQGGLGVGLTLVRSLVTLHGGSVEAHSEGPNRGSEFIVRLPTAPPPEPSAGEPDDQPASTRNSPRRRVLVVDDNVAAARILGEITALWGHEIQIAHSGEEAIEAAAACRPDVVLLDIGLPGISGYEVARRFRQQPELAGTLLVAITGYGQEDDRRRSQEAGFDHHLVKPVTPESLEALLNSPSGEWVSASQPEA